MRAGPAALFRSADAARPLHRSDGSWTPYAHALAAAALRERYREEGLFPDRNASGDQLSKRG